VLEVVHCAVKYRIQKRFSIAAVYPALLNGMPCFTVTAVLVRISAAAEEGTAKKHHPRSMLESFAKL
jgi:hypothetical protein